MKYRLKKDLPFAKAGEEIKVDDDCDIWTVRPLNIEIDCPLCDIPKETRDEWIEEVKPREWWLIPNTLPAFEPYAIKGADADISGYKGVIKVREVLE